MWSNPGLQRTATQKINLKTVSWWKIQKSIKKIPLQFQNWSWIIYHKPFFTRRGVWVREDWRAVEKEPRCSLWAGKSLDMLVCTLQHQPNRDTMLLLPWSANQTKFILTLWLFQKDPDREGCHVECRKGEWDFGFTKASKSDFGNCQRHMGPGPHLPPQNEWHWAEITSDHCWEGDTLPSPSRLVSVHGSTVLHKSSNLQLNLSQLTGSLFSWSWPTCRCPLLQ